MVTFFPLAMLQTKRRKTTGADGNVPLAGGSDSEHTDNEGVEQVGLD